ncbi:MAG: CehA/McbA family metallohydrolase [Sphaerochaetaceae bacterium]
MKERYLATREWFKGNTHLHTTLSDGGKTPAQVASLYRGAGYDFIAITDHWHVFKPQSSLPSEGGLLILGGIEVDGRDAQGQYYHVVALGTLSDIQPDNSLERTLERLVSQQAFLVLAHPYWCGNQLGDLQRFPFHAMEIYNHVCEWLNGKGQALYLWDTALTKRIAITGIASDDAHLLIQHPGWNGGWIMVQSSELSSSAILQALRLGRFYATTGPLFHSIRYGNGRVTCETSPIVQARLVGKDYLGDRVKATQTTQEPQDLQDSQDPQEKPTMTSFSFKVDPDTPLAKSPYLRLEIEDSHGHRAWTNTLYYPQPD